MKDFKLDKMNRQEKSLKSTNYDGVYFLDNNESDSFDKQDTPKPSKVLVVDDEINILEILKENLEREGYDVASAIDGEMAIHLHNVEKPDLILLDCMLPGLSGFEVCKKIRAISDVPILMLTARAEELDKVLGLELGADDYITKPFSIREVCARVKANIRRYQHKEATASLKEEGKILEFGDLIIDTNTYEVRLNNKTITLTLREFELLRCLAEHSGQVFSREALLHRVWGYNYYGDARTVDVTVRRTREKIEPDAPSNNYKYIMTKRGVGYYFESKNSFKKKAPQTDKEKEDKTSLAENSPLSTSNISSLQPTSFEKNTSSHTKDDIFTKQLSLVDPDIAVNTSNSKKGNFDA